MSLYETLGVARDADAGTIKKSFRKKAMQHHPDRPDGNHEDMQAVQKAYDVLSDPARRQRYDETGATDLPQSLRDRAAGVLAGLFNEVIDKIDGGDRRDAAVIDPVGACQENLQAALANNERNRKALQRKIEHRRKVLKRLQRKSAGTDILEAAVLGAVMGLEEQIKSIDGMDDLCREVLTLLGDYEYTVDTAAPQSTHFSFELPPGFKFGP